MSPGYEQQVANSPMTPLPRGRHKLPPATVRASQRSRLIRAMLESVGNRGYEATTVPEVVAAARVSRNAFYSLFDDKLECFLALCEELAGELLDETFRVADADDWGDALRNGTRRYLRWWQSRPLLSRALLLEVRVAGPRAVAQRDRACERFREGFELLARRARHEDPLLAPLRRAVPEMLVTSITELIAAEVAAGRVAELESLEDDLVWLVRRLLTEPS